jgi:hypothetical protein
MPRRLQRIAIASVAALPLAACNSSPASPSSSHSGTAMTAVRERRTPNPAPGAQLPLPDHFYVVAMVAAQYPEALASACPEKGGTWEFMDRVVDALRLEDSRWGYSRRRDPSAEVSQDVIAYNYSADPDDGTLNVYAVDILHSQCGGNSTPTWTHLEDAGRARTTWTRRRR